MLFLLLSCIFASNLMVEAADPTVNLTVYYESLCSDSINFITTQLFPAWQHFGTDLRVSFRPFGKADFTSYGNSWVFTCQHGPEECHGNKVQACVLDQVNDQEEIVPLIDCLMGSKFPPTAAEECLAELNISTTTTANVNGCAETDEGSNLLHEIGVETKALDPKLYFVPWVLFNDKFDEEAWQGALDDLKLVLCSKFLSGSSKC